MSYDKLLMAQLHAEARKARERKPQPQVVKVERDETGIRYLGIETPTPRPEAPQKDPIKVRSKRAAEKLGWAFVNNEPEHVRQVGGTPFFQKVPGSFVAEYSGSFRPEDPPRTHRQTASSLEGLLRNIEDFERRRQQ